MDATTIQFMSLQLLGLSHRISGKVKNAIYSLETSALVLEIIKFKKCKKYASERNDDVIYSTQYNIKSVEQKGIFDNGKQHPSSHTDYLFVF